MVRRLVLVLPLYRLAVGQGACAGGSAMSGKVHVTQHALLRYIERVERVTLAEARARIMSSEKAIIAAADFGCSHVLLPCRAKLALCGLHVVSVYAPEAKRSARSGRTIEHNGGRRARERQRRKWCNEDE